MAITARHWRVFFSGTATGVGLSIREVAFLDSGGIDLSIAGVASASSVNGANTADKAFDKNTATAWAPSGVEYQSSLTYDHTVPVSVSQVRIDIGNIGSLIAAPSSIRWANSADGVNWSSPAPLLLVSGSVASSTEATYDLLQRSDFAVSLLPGEVAAFVGSVLPSGMPVTYVPDGAAPFHDFEFGGFGRIAGTVKEDGTPDVPVKRRVRLHREQDGLVVREVWSHPTTGAYSFDYIDATKRYTVITYDYEHDYRAVIADNITPEAMP